MPRRVAVLMILLALCVPASGGWGSAFDEHIERLVATPTPVGPALVASDRWAWSIELDDAAYVEVLADSPTSAFTLSASCVPGLVLVPNVRQGIACSTPGVHTIEVDPVAGAAFDIHVRFRGHVGDRDGAPHAFGFQRTAADQGCVVPGVCLP